jgi:hypothetical protein
LCNSVCHNTTSECYVPRRMRLRRGCATALRAPGRLGECNKLRRRAPEQRRDALARRVCEARLYSDTWPPLAYISTRIQAIVSACRRIDATSCFNASATPPLYANQLIIGFQLALFWGDPPFPYAIRQSRLPIPHDGEGRRRTHRHSEEKPAAILSHAIPESPRHLEQPRGTTRPKCSFRIHLDCHDRPVSSAIR